MPAFSRRWLLALTVAATLHSWVVAGEFQPLKYQQPELVVDLGVGLWAIPLPLDYDGDGDLDLLVSTSNKTSPGVYFFENPGGQGKLPVFKPAVRVGAAHSNINLTWHGDHWSVMTPGARHPEFLKQGLTAGEKVDFQPKFHCGRANQWQQVDYDGDGNLDLLIGVSDWRQYGWDDAFDSSGNWTQGPLHGYVYFVKNLGDNQKPRYGQAQQLQADGKPLDVYGCPSPNLADWDKDGDLDLVCGSFLDTLTYFQNIGTRTAPQYAAGRVISYDQQPIKMDLQMLRVVSCDWDGDGDVDLIVGQEDGRVALLENSSKLIDRSRSFLPPRFFQQQADQLKVGALTTPAAVDWDGDGDEDLVCGDTAGYLHLVENIDGGNPPRWAVPRMLEAGGRTIRIQAGENGSIQGPAEAKWGYTVPGVGDFNGDGLQDVVINSIRGEVLWYQNLGPRKSPKLRAAQRVQVAWNGPTPKPAWNWWNPQENSLVTQWRTSPVLHDLTGDGRLDLVMLDQEGYLALFEQRASDSTKPILNPPRRIFLDEDGSPLHLNSGRAGKSGRRKLTLADWDGDGRLDLLVNSKSVDFYKNIGRGQEFRFRNQGPVSPQVLAGHTTCPTTVDWNGDGKPDLVVGAEDGFLYYLPNPRTGK